MLNHLIVVDDNESDLLFTRIVIQKAGIASKVSVFEDARDAIGYLQRDDHGVDLILLDINMPGMDGFAFLAAFEEVRRSRQAAPPVVVMLTSSPDPRDRERAFAFASVRDYVVKPITVEQAQGFALRLSAVGDGS
jgi:CheY-like chemotaxis protein